MPALARNHITDSLTRAANDDCINGGSCTRTKYSYDANGNALTRQGSSITWSSYNYPTTINAGSGSTAETVALSYGPDRKRWQQSYTGNGVTDSLTDYIGGLFDLLNGSTYRHYIYAGAEPVAVYLRNNSGVYTLDYFLSDHQSSLTSITNSSGAAVVGESFTPFGARRNPNTWSGPPSSSDLNTIVGITRQGYTFQTVLGLWMNLNHMNGRVQDAVTGRFLSADPHIPDRSNSQSYNRYSYLNNNPLAMVDPTGFFDRVNCVGVTRCPLGADFTSYTPPNAVGGFSSWGFGTSVSAGSSDGDVAAFAQGLDDAVTNALADGLAPGNLVADTATSDDSGSATADQPSSGGQGTTAIQTVTVTAAAPDANPTIQFDPTPELLAGGARSPRFPCTWCGAPHGGAYGPYCPSCNGKSKLPNGGVPPNPDPPDWDTDDDSPPAQADPDNGNQNWLIIGAGFLLLWLLLQDATA